MTDELTRSPLGMLIDKSADILNLKQYGRKHFIFFAVGLAGTLLVLTQLQTLPFVRGTSPSHPEWKVSLSDLTTQVNELFSKLIYTGAFVLGVSQAVKKQKDIFNPDLKYIILYGKLILFLFAVEFICNLLLSPTSTQKGAASGASFAAQSNADMIVAFLSWVRNISVTISRHMIQGASAGFGYGYLIRGVGILFDRYRLMDAD
jgi:hypothetical protein